MLRLSEEQIAEMERLHTAATEGEWDTTGDSIWFADRDGFSFPVGTLNGGSRDENKANANSTVALHNNAEALFADWRELRRVVEWYATNSNYWRNSVQDVIGGYKDLPSTADEDNGKLARQTLGLEP